MAQRSLTLPPGRSSLARPGLGFFGPFGLLHREIDRLFDDFARDVVPVTQTLASVLPTLVPSIDVTETDKEIHIAVEMPGLERKDVEITVEGDTLTIRGEKRSELGQDGQGGQNGQGAQGGEDGQGGQNAQSTQNGQKRNVRLAERNYGVFVRVLELPPGIDPSKIEATMSNGVLRIRIPKPAESEPKKIEVKEAA
jgi:HSP20 family protein